VNIHVVVFQSKCKTNITVGMTIRKIGLLKGTKV